MVWVLVECILLHTPFANSGNWDGLPISFLEMDDFLKCQMQHWAIKLCCLKCQEKPLFLQTELPCGLISSLWNDSCPWEEPFFSYFEMLLLSCPEKSGLGGSSGFQTQPNTRKQCNSSKMLPFPTSPVFPETVMTANHCPPSSHFPSPSSCSSRALGDVSSRVHFLYVVLKHFSAKRNKEE